MATLENHGGLEVLDAATGDGGMAISDNFRRVANWHPRSVWNKNTDPTATDDGTETNPDDPEVDQKNYQVGSLWLNTSTGQQFVCVDNTPSNARWVRIPYVLLAASTGANGSKLSGNLDGNSYTISNATYNGTSATLNNPSGTYTTFTLGGLAFNKSANTLAVNELNTSPGNSSQFAYHWTSGSSSKDVVFCIAKTGINTAGFAQDGTNLYFYNEQASSGAFIWKKGVGFGSTVSTSGQKLMTLSHLGTLSLFNETASTGVTQMVVKAGQGQSSTQLTQWQNFSGTALSVVTATGSLGVGTSSPGAMLDVAGVGRFLSSGASTPSTGTAVEIFYDSLGDSGSINSINRSTSTLKPLQLSASSIAASTGINAASSGTAAAFAFDQTLNQTGTAGSILLDLTRIDTALGSGTHSFLRCMGGSAGATLQFVIDRLGSMSASAPAIITNTNGAAGASVLIVRGKSTQTGALQQWVNNSFGLKAQVDVNGTFYGTYSDPIITKSSNYTATDADSVILVSGNTTITLPSAATRTGRKFTFKKTDAGTTMTIGTTSSQTIDGAATYTSGTQWNTVTVISDGTN